MIEAIIGIPPRYTSQAAGAAYFHDRTLEILDCLQLGLLLANADGVELLSPVESALHPRLTLLLASRHPAHAAVDRKESPTMKLFRYRKPSLNQLLGVTAAKRRVKRDLGISQVEAWTEPSRVKQRVTAKVGLYSPVARVIRQTSKGKLPTFLGLFGRKR